MVVKAIETKYKGYRFRSRLESRWAIFLDTLGIEWEYEKEGYQTRFGYYLPDFWLPRIGCFAEVKDDLFSETEYKKCTGLPKPCFMLDQPHPMAMPYYVAGVSEEWSKYPDMSNGYGWAVLSASNYKERIWLLLGEDYYSSHYLTELPAEQAAKSARFEHGESG